MTQETETILFQRMSVFSLIHADVKCNYAAFVLGQTVMQYPVTTEHSTGTRGNHQIYTRNNILDSSVPLANIAFQCFPIAFVGAEFISAYA